ncbi:MAG TPA: hypothetical protein VK129_01775 [Terriglobales bacterium]|nr:hypothetical protein [Terriglobales bacterium]
MNLMTHIPNSNNAVRWVPDEEAATFISNQNSNGPLRWLRQILLAFRIFEFVEEFKSAIM